MTTRTSPPPPDLDTDPVHRVTPATAEEVWAVLANGWTYPCWVAGAGRMRAVGANYPMPGATLHHSFGAWPTLIDDKTICIQADVGRRLLLDAHGWPFGEAIVDIRLTPVGSGTRISMAEDATAGPGRWLIPALFRQGLIRARNTESLRRLAYLVEQSDAP